MGDRRMFSKRIVESSRFLKLPDAAQKLYFHLVMNTDDDGIVEAFTVLRICGSDRETLQKLEDAHLICILNDDLVTYIEDWQEQNSLRPDRKKDSLYLDLLRQERPDVVILERKPRSDKKNRKGKDRDPPSTDRPWTVPGQSAGGPGTAQDRRNKSNIREVSVSEYQSISPSQDEGGREGTDFHINIYRKIIADNINLELLKATAKGLPPSETVMIEEIYEIICDVVCFPRESVMIKNIPRPWETVKSQFLKLRYDHIADVLNRVIDSDLHIRNMKQYIISVLYEESMSGTLGIEASLHDQELKMLRGQPY